MKKLVMGGFTLLSILTSAQAQTLNVNFSHYLVVNEK